MNLRQLSKLKIKLDKKYNLKDKHILLITRLPKYTRITIEKKIVELGGILEEKPTIDTDVVVFTRTDTYKYKKSQELNSEHHITFVEDADFLENYLKME